MADALALAWFDLRTRLRGRAAAASLLAALAALALGLTVRGGAGAALATTWYPWALGAWAFGVAAASAATLPADRAEGRAAWLASLGPSAAARRAGAALAGAALAVGAGLGGGALVGLLAPLLGTARELREAEPVPLPALRRFRDPARGGEPRPLALSLPPATADGPRTLDVELRPLLLLAEAEPPEQARLSWTAGVLSGETSIPLRGRLRLPLPAGAQDVVLRLEVPGLDYVVREAHVLGAARPFLPSALWMGLLVGLGAAWLAPLAVALSRGTTATTAAGATLVLVALAGMRVVLPDLQRLQPAGPLESLARGLVGLCVALAPDLGALSAAAEPAAGRALGAGALSGLAALTPHLGASLLLLLVPGPRRAPQGEGA